MNPTDDYVLAIELAKDQHRKSKTYSGKFLRPHGKRIKDIVDRLGCASALDFGAGKGLQYSWKMPSGETLEEYWGIEVAKYDPAYPPFAEEPTGTYDLVICSHVLGIIPIPDLDWVIPGLYGLANKALYIALNTGGETRAKKARWRVKNIPSSWGAEQWMEILKKHKNKDIEVHFIARPKVPNKTSGIFLL